MVQKNTIFGDKTQLVQIFRVIPFMKLQNDT